MKPVRLPFRHKGIYFLLVRAKGLEPPRVSTSHSECGASTISPRSHCWCHRVDLNHRPPPYQGIALPAELRRRRLCFHGSVRARHRPTFVSVTFRHGALSVPSVRLSPTRFRAATELVPPAGFEPATFALQMHCTTAVLKGRNQRILSTRTTETFEWCHLSESN